MTSLITFGLLSLTAAVLLVSGRWRMLMRPFRINSRRMTVERLGLLATDPRDIERINGILASFAGGFNEIIAGPSAESWRDQTAKLPLLLRPFSHEGAAMGYRLRYPGRFDPQQFESRLVARRPDYRYLYYVGLGFWAGMARYSPRRLMKLSQGLDPLHSYLLFDGYGFKHAFFDHVRKPESLRRLDGLDGYARNSAYQGVGRAFWFRFMDQPAVLIDHIRNLGGYANDAAAGVGLASVFTNPDSLESARRLAQALPAEWHASMHLGMCFGLKARSITDRDAFESYQASLPGSVRDAISASVRECDRVELQVRAASRPDGYAHWRSTVAQWMTDHIEYPIASVRQVAREAADIHSETSLRGVGQ